jgi:uncharacterized membrane protein YphA (DoxX/SURF4 family)
MVGLRRVAVWVGAIFLAAVMAAAGVSKLHGVSARGWAQRFERWGYPPNAHYVVGVIEVLGAIGVLIPGSRRAASLTLGVLMVGAMGTHVVHAEYPRVIPPLVLGSVAFAIARGRSTPPDSYRRSQTDLRC